MHDPTADERTRDRQLRAQIDPLIGQLSFTGKWELVMRLALESVRQGFTDTPLPGTRAQPELPVIVGSSVRKRDGGGEEAQGQEPAAAPDHTD